MTNAEIIEAVKSMTVLELSELVKAIEAEFGVSAAAPVMVAGAGAAAAPVEEEKTEFDVILKGFDAASKIKVIKEVRGITGLGLKEAKELVDNVPGTLKEAISKEEAEAIKKQLAEVGAEVEFK